MGQPQQYLLGKNTFLEKLSLCSRTKAPSRKTLAPSSLPTARPWKRLAGAESRSLRDAAIGKACHEFGYTQAHVAAATGLHYSTVSKNYSKIGIIQEPSPSSPLEENEGTPVFSHQGRGIRVPSVPPKETFRSLARGNGLRIFFLFS